MKGNLVVYHTCGRCGNETTKSIFMPFCQTIDLPPRVECRICGAKTYFSRALEDGKTQLSQQLSFECPHCGKWSKCKDHKIGLDDITGYDNLTVPDKVACQMCEEAVNVPKSEGGYHADD